MPLTTHARKILESALADKPATDELVSAIGTGGGSADAVLTTEEYVDPPWLVSVPQATVAGLPDDLAAKAPVADPVFTGSARVVGLAAGTGGDRQNLQTATGTDIVRYDANGTAHHHLGTAANPSNLVACWHPAEVDPTYPVTFNHSLSSNPNPNDDPTSWNNVAELGWNSSGGGSQVADNYAFRDAWENHYFAAGVGDVFQTERHVGVVRDPVTGLEVRPYTCAVVVSEGWPFRTQISLSTSDFRVLDETANTLIVKNTWNSATSEYAANSPGWGYTTNPTGGFSGLIGDVGGPTTFALTGNTVSIPFKIAGVQKFELFAGSDSSFSLNDAAGSNILFFDQSKNAFFQGTALFQQSKANAVVQRWQNFQASGGDGDFSWVMPGSGSPSGWLYLTHQSGTIPVVFSKVGLAFFGASPVARQAAIPDTSGATLVQLEAEINKIKQLVRNYNLMAP